MADQPYGRDFFVGENDEAGIPWDNFVTALQVWAFMRGEVEGSSRRVTVRAAAEQFGVTDAVIREAVEEHYWMEIAGPSDDPTKQFIEHEGA